MTKLQVQESKTLEDGKHQGKIVEIENKPITVNGEDKPYLHIWIKPTDADFKLKYSVSHNLSEKSKLGKLLKNFNIGLSVGQEIDIEPTLIDKDVVFVTIQKQGNTGKFVEIAEDSIKPIVSEENVAA